MPKSLWTVIVALIAFALFPAAAALACGVEGNVRYPDGSSPRAQGSVTSSWNRTVAYVSNGSYRLDLGSAACGQEVTVYLNGRQPQRIRLPGSGFARVNWTMPSP